MKFLCDRCSTRYSIGDDRVRGKILKIRCKSCGNVITVREGMPSPDDVDPPAADAADAADAAAPAGPRRAHKSTTGAPGVHSEAPASGGALGAAFASAMARPPALEPEWYVSLEGAQSGPFSLAAAQRWIAGQPPDAELFCWSEGFDDWLPVDKVSQFRGLRKPAPPPAPPAPPAPPSPPPRAGALRGATPRPEPVTDGPRPLFAATMAQVEKGGAPAAAAPPRPLEPRGVRPLATPPAGAPRANGAAAQMARGGAPSTLAARGASPGVGGRPPGRGGSLPADAFDASELADSATQLDAPIVDPSGLRPAPRAAPAGSPPRDSLTRIDPRAAPAAPVSSLMFPEPAPGDPGGGDDLDIAEVSRVVRLADLAREAGAEPQVAPVPQAVPVPLAPQAGHRTGPIARLEGNRTGPIARLEGNRTGPIARLEGNRTGAIARLDGGGPLAAAPFANGAGGDAALPSGAEPAPPPAQVSHRRALIALISGAVVLVGVAVAVVFFVLTSHEEPRSRLGQVEEIDTTRPEEPRPGGSGGGSAAAPADTPATPTTPKVQRRVTMPPTGPGTPAGPEGPDAGGKLEAREIEEMAGKNASLTQRCYMRAQRGADGILLADVKKISVTLTINGEGQVTDAQLSDNHAQDSLGKCLIAAIRSWRFRASPGGTFRFVLHFG